MRFLRKIFSVKNLFTFEIVQEHDRFGIGVREGQFGQGVALGLALVIVFVKVTHRLINGNKVAKMSLKQEEDGSNLIKEELHHHRRG